MGSNEKKIALAIGAALALAMGVIWVVPKPAPAPEEPVAEVTPAAAPQETIVAEPETVVAAEPEVIAEAEPEVIAEAEPEVVEEAEPEVVAEAEPEEVAAIVPTFDSFQREADGAALVAGRADPFVAVDVYLAGQVVSRAQTDGAGTFVTFVTVDPSDQPRTLYLVSDPEGAAVRSDETIIVAPFAPVVVAEAPTEPDVAVAEAEVVVEDPVLEDVTEVVEDVTEGVETVTEGVETVAEVVEAQIEDVVEAEPVIEEPVIASATVVAPDVVVEQPIQEVVVAEVEVNSVKEKVTEEVVEAPTEDVAEAPLPVAAPVLVSDAEGVRVLQPSDTAPDVLSNVALDAITYDPTGEVLLSGRAQGEGFVQVYIDNQPITTSRIAEGGGWRTELPEIDTGVYTLRIDEVDDAGTVVSRVETPSLQKIPRKMGSRLPCARCSREVRCGRLRVSSLAKA